MPKSRVHLRVQDLVARKQAGNELGLEAPDTLLNTFIEEQLDKWSKQSFDTQDQPALTLELESVLMRILAENAHQL